jgi:hypothetical protein
LLRSVVRDCCAVDLGDVSSLPRARDVAELVLDIAPTRGRTLRYLRTDTVPIEQLASYPGNARVHDDAALDESAKLNGQYRSIVARTMPDGALQVLAGHGTLGAFARAGDKTVRADDTEARRIVLVDNGASRHASYDDALLLRLLDDASTAGGLDGTGWDGESYRKLLASAGENPFDFAEDDDLDRLDQLKGVECPECGHEFVPGQ